MKITFEQNTNQTKTDIYKTYERQPVRSKSVSGNAVFSRDGKNRVLLPQTDAEDIKKQAANIDMDSYRDGMIVAASNMSDEDYAKMLEEGYEPSAMTPEETVTILDKIKSELLKAGKHIAGYTDDMDTATLAAAVGSAGLAQSLQAAFAQADVPMTEENVEQVLQALSMGQVLHEPTQGELYYMLAGSMELTISDFYMAQASSHPHAQASPVGTEGQYFGEAIRGYVTRNVAAGENTADHMETQIKALFEKLDIAPTEENMERAGWLLEKGLGITRDNMSFLENVGALTFPLSEEMLMEGAVAALAEGRPAAEGRLCSAQTNLEKASELYELYQGEAGKNLIHDRRLLEEIRLHMTVETNLKLLESGFSIDTASIEETIEALKRAEESIAQKYFPEAERPVESYRLLEEANRIIKDIPGLPFKTVVHWADRLSEVSVEEFHETGRMLENEYKQAKEAYETIRTQPRSDMGDNIQKAFRNVDALLQELGYEQNEENRKAVRGLAYNELELTAENMEKLKEANRQVCEVVSRLTPAKTLEMIRAGYNPLDSTFEEIASYLDSLPADKDTQERKYSRFLQRLDHAGAITQEEREAFIGCYRLMRQMEKADGAATGSILRTGAELTFANLLSAVRSGRYKGMDVRISDAVGEVCERILQEPSISEQIERAFGENARQEYAQAAELKEDVSDMLHRSGMPVTTENVLAAGMLHREPQKAVSELEKRTQKKGGWLEKLSEKENFSEEYVSELERLSEELSEESLAQTDFLDVREKQLLSKQMHMMKNLAKQEEFYFGMELGGEQINVHLRMEESQESRGQIQITLSGERLGTISGSLQAAEDGVNGFFVGNQPQIVRNLRENADIINAQLAEEWNLKRVEFIYSEKEYSAGSMPWKATDIQYSAKELYGLAKDFLLGLKRAGEAS